MKALVTGGAGFIGSNLVDCLVDRGHQVSVMDNESSEVHEQFYWNKNAKNVNLDICEYNEGFLSWFRDIDVVFHLAAEARIQPSIKNPTVAVKTNTLGTCNVLQAAREQGVKRVVYSSTSSAYGFNPIPNKEDMPKDCLNPYSVSKTAGEDLCSMYTKLFGLETITFRYFNVYGERQPIKGQYAPVIGIFQKQNKEGKPLTIVPDGHQRRDFTHVSDVVEANILAATKDLQGSYGEIINIGTGENHSVLEVASMLSDKTVFIEPRIGESKETLADISKAKKILGWEPKVKLEDWIKK